MANLLNVNPTRQELLKLKKKLKHIRRGHKLLKDKRDGLMKEFMTIIKEAADLRKKVEKELRIAFKHFLFSSAIAGFEKIKSVFPEKISTLDIRLEKRNIMGVETYKFYPQNLNQETSLVYSLASANYDFDLMASSFKQVSGNLLKLAELEHAAKLLSREIEKTRRRVNALEYILIPKAQETIKYIQEKINEQERGAIVGLMKLKKLLQKII